MMLYFQALSARRFQLGFDRVNLHRLTLTASMPVLGQGTAVRVAAPHTRGLHSFPFQLNLSSSVHRITQLES
jgi:hypothetical protein